MTLANGISKILTYYIKCVRLKEEACLEISVIKFDKKKHMRFMLVHFVSFFFFWFYRGGECLLLSFKTSTSTRNWQLLIKYLAPKPFFFKEKNILQFIFNTIDFSHHVRCGISVICAE